MKLISFEDVLGTYSAPERESTEQFLLFQQLRKKYPEYGYKRLAKLIGTNKARTRWWKQKNGSPTSLQTIHRLIDASLLPLTSGDPRLPSIARILGSLFTDGGIDKNLNTIHFNSSVPENLEAWKRDLLSVFPWVEKTISVIETGEFGHSFCIRSTDRAVIRFFQALGTPVGNKTRVQYLLPGWVFKTPNNVKTAFLDGFLSGEASIPQIRTRKAGVHFANFSLSLSKEESLEESHLAFLESLGFLLASFGLNSTKIRKDKHLRRKCKDGLTTCSYRLLFSASAENVRNFHQLIPLSYAVEKKQKLDQIIDRFFSKLPNCIRSRKGFPATPKFAR